MLEYRTEGFNGYAVKYSPFFDSRLAVAAAANFGLVGNGRFYIFDLTPNGIVPLKWYTTQDSLFDLAWSEINENHALVACGDGSIKLFDAMVDDFPVMNWKEHTREVFSVHWNLVAKDRFASSSWDGSVKIWSPERPQSLLTLPTLSCTYSTEFSPHSPDIVSCVSSDSYLRVFDLRTPGTNHLALQIPIHAPGTATPKPPAPPIVAAGMPPPPAATPPSEALTHDWNKYRPSIVASAGVDRTIRTFDIRAPQQGPLTVMVGHDYAIRRLSWSPHLSNVLLSASYDMTCRIWSDESDTPMGAAAAAPGIGGPAVGREMGRMGRHTEFVTGIDWCMFGAEGWAASTGWDERLCVFDVRGFMV